MNGSEISVLYVTNKILSRDSNYIVDVVMWQKFGNSCIFMREVIIKKHFFEVSSWYKFNF